MIDLHCYISHYFKKNEKHHHPPTLSPYHTLKVTKAPCFHQGLLLTLCLAVKFFDEFLTRLMGISSDRFISAASNCFQLSTRSLISLHL